MKKFFLLIIISSLYLLNGDGQISLSLGSDSEDGLTSRLYSFITADAGNWSFYNSTQLKFSEVQDNVAGYYQENIARNILHAWQMHENWDIGLYLGLGISPEDDHPTEITGDEGLFQYTNSLSLGGNFNYDNSKLYIDINTDYISTAYDRYNARETSTEQIRENDLLWNLAAGHWLSNDLLLTANWDHFNDLNENDSFNYSTYFLQAEYEHRLNYIHFITQDVELGYSDLDEDLTNYIRTYTRLSSKFAQDWTLLNILTWQGWLEEDMSDIYIGNSWYETNIRRNFNVSENNQLTYAQIGALYEFDTEIFAVNYAVQYYLSNFKLFSKGRYFTGDERWLDYEFYTGTACELIDQNLNIAYQWGIRQDFDGSRSNLHQLILEYYY